MVEIGLKYSRLNTGIARTAKPFLALSMLSPAKRGSTGSRDCRPFRRKRPFTRFCPAEASLFACALFFRGCGVFCLLPALFAQPELLQLLFELLDLLFQILGLLFVPVFQCFLLFLAQALQLLLQCLDGSASTLGASRPVYTIRQKPGPIPDIGIPFTFLPFSIARCAGRGNKTGISCRLIEWANKL